MENIENSNLENVENKVYSEEELKKAIELAREEALKEAQSDIDRKITNALKTREENLMNKYNEEKKELVNKNLTAEEQLKNLQMEIETIKKDNRVKSNRLEIEREFSNNGFGGEDIRNVLDNIVSEDLEKSKNMATSILNLINNEKTKLSDTYNQKMTNVPKPQQNTDKNMTKEDFNKLSISEMMEFCKTNPDLASKYMS